MIEAEWRSSVLKLGSFLVWLPLICFIALLLTMFMLTALSPGHSPVFAAVEWAEMIIGTSSAFLAVVAAFWPRATTIGQQSSRGGRWVAICGLAIWVLFWLLALLTRRWVD
jgi:hypothetical protein